jgi:Glycosyltransferase
MKIAYLFGSLNRGGTETLYLDLFRNASIVPYEMIYIHRKGGQYQNDFQSTSVSGCQIRIRSPFDMVSLLRLRKLCKREHVDIIHAQQSIDAIYSWMATVGLKTRVIGTFHYFPSKKMLIDKVAHRLSKAYIFVSGTQKSKFESLYGWKSHKHKIVYNGVSFSKMDTTGEIKPVLPSLEEKTILIGSVGNFVRVRDQMTICRFLNLLNANAIDFQFVFSGAKSKVNPELYDDCVHYCHEKGLDEKVHFLGSRNDVPSILKQLDAFVYASDYDTFGIAVVEAIATGVPTFVNDWDVMKEITENGKLAVLYETKDENDLFEKFMMFMCNRDLYKLNAEKSASMIRDKFSIKEFADNLFSVYCNVLYLK